MKTRVFFLRLSVFLFINSYLIASVVDYDFNLKDPAVFQVTNFEFKSQGSGLHLLETAGMQYDQTVHFNGNFTTNKKPVTIRISEDIQNLTSFTWTGYRIYLSMTNCFAISDPVVPAGWSWTIKDPVFVSDGSLSGWLGEIDFKGQPVDFGDRVLLGFNISFTGDTSFCTSHVANPEPASIMLLGLGSFALLRRRHSNH